MTYEQAKKIALKINSKFNASKEYKIAYYFYNKHENLELLPGNDIVILKDTGKILNLTTFILDYLPEKNPKDIDF